MQKKSSRVPHCLRTSEVKTEVGREWSTALPTAWWSLWTAWLFMAAFTFLPLTTPPILSTYCNAYAWWKPTEGYFLPQRNTPDMDSPHNERHFYMYVAPLRTFRPWLVSSPYVTGSLIYSFQSYLCYTNMDALLHKSLRLLLPGKIVHILQKSRLLMVPDQYMQLHANFSLL